MRKLIATLLLFLAISAAMSAASAEIQVIARLMRIIDIDTQQDIVTAVDAVGFEWRFYGVDEWEIGDYANVVLIWDDVKPVTDAEIISIFYERPDLLVDF